MTYEQLLKLGYKKASQNNKEQEAVKLLLMELSNYTPSQFFLNLKEEVNQELQNIFNDKLNMYIFDSTPVQHLIGYSYFFGHKIKVNDAVLIPRSETEQLVEYVLHYYDSYFNSKKIEVLDLGTGSGCIGLALALEEKNINITISDLSEKALKVATFNNDNLKAGAKIIQSDWFNNIKGKFDIIVSNPPYIPNYEQVENIVDKEPHIALFGGKKGVDFYEEILKNIKPYLNEKALIAFEHGFQQKQQIYEIASKQFPRETIIQKKDLSGKDRFTFIGFNGVFKDK